MIEQAFETAFHAIAASPAEAEQMVARAELMMQIEDIIRRNGWTQTEAARRCGVNQPRINELMRHDFHKFSLDALVNIAANLRQRTHIVLSDRQVAA